MSAPREAREEGQLEDWIPTIYDGIVTASFREPGNGKVYWAARWERGLSFRMYADTRLEALRLLIETTPDVVESVLAPSGETEDDERDDLVNRLRGVYRIPVEDGAGPLNGEDHCTRQFTTSPIQHEAADEIERLRARLSREVQRAAPGGEEVERGD